MARTCNCVGYLSNPGGRCCMDLQQPSPPQVGSIKIIPAALTEERIREIIREEIERVKLNPHKESFDADTAGLGSREP